MLSCNASGGGYGGSAGRSGGYSSGGGGGGSAGGFSAGSGASSGGNFAGGVISAAIQTRHNIEYKDVPSGGNIQPAMIEVGASPIPVNILFRSASSNLNVLQQHQGAGGDTQESQSEDEPHMLKHTVTKPIIQEVREVISPFRKITQEIQPVQEEINTIVARDQNNGMSGHVPVGNSVRMGGSGTISLGGGTGALSLGGAIGGQITVGEVKGSSGSVSGIGKGLSGKSAGGYAKGSSGSSSKASSGGY